MLTKALDNLLQSLGRASDEARPLVLEETDENEVVEPNLDGAEVERDPEEVAFMHTISTALGTLSGRVFPTSAPNASLKLLRVFRPTEDKFTDDFQFVLPVKVEYIGTAAPEAWGAAERALEQEFAQKVLLLAQDAFENITSVKLKKRSKSDPFEGPTSLTILRYAVT